MHSVLSVLLLFLALPVRAQTDDKVKEPATEVEFNTVERGYELLGVGVRKKLIFKIYAAALYVKIPDAVEPLRGAKDPCDMLVRGAFPWRMIMHFVRDVPGDKARETFRENLDRVMTDDELAKCVEDRRRYLVSVGGDIEEGARFIVDYADGRLRAYVDGRLIYETANHTLIRGISRIWYGPKPLSEELKAGLVSRLGRIID